MEARLHDEGYDHRSIPGVHMSERRRLFEGRRILNEMERNQRRQSMPDEQQQEIARQERKEDAKAAYREHFYGSENGEA